MNNTKLIALILVALLSWPLFASGEGHAAFGEQWHVTWRFIGEEIEFTMTAPTTGWVSVGFNPSVMMRNAHFVIGYVKDGRGFARDDWGTSNTGHSADVSRRGGVDNVRIIDAREETQVTTIVFALPTHSGDPHDVEFIPGRTYTILAAYGPNGQDNFTSRHRARSSRSVVL